MCREKSSFPTRRSSDLVSTATVREVPAGFTDVGVPVAELLTLTSSLLSCTRVQLSSEDVNVSSSATGTPTSVNPAGTSLTVAVDTRSEERRVGKELFSRHMPVQLN